MDQILIGGVVLLIIIVILLIVVYVKRKTFGTLAGKSVYTDTNTLQGEVLYSEKLQLKGKPDYVIKKGKSYIPVEVKTGRTPTMPYKNHVAQLFAYCALIEEKYSVRPKYGVVKYPEREFEIEYTTQGEKALQLAIKEMMELKKSGIEPQCKHPDHN